MAFTRTWDESQPADSDRVYSGASEIRNLRKDFRERINTMCPVGLIIEWPTETVPDMWLECNGSAISRSTYATLFAVIGTTFGVGDGSTTFNLPNLKGIFPQGWPHTATTSDSDVSSMTATVALTSGSTSATVTFTSTTSLPRINASVSGTGIASGTRVSAINQLTGALTLSVAATSTGSYTLTFGNNVIGTYGWDQIERHQHVSYRQPNYITGTGAHTGGYGWNIASQITSSSGGNETRPQNKYTMFIIRYSAL